MVLIWYYIKLQNLGNVSAINFGYSMKAYAGRRRTNGAKISEREGSRVGAFLFDEVRVFHRPHPSPDTDKGVVASIRKWLDEHGVKP